MSSSPLTDRLQETFDAGRDYLTDHFGRRGLKTNEQIHPDIHWNPSIQVRINGIIVVAEVSDVLYPKIISESFAEIISHTEPISVYVICPLEVYAADAKQTLTARLAEFGIGIITVSDRGRATQQRPCGPLVQNISERELETKIRPLSPTLKRRFRNAHDTYRTNIGQGLQEAGQTVEALITTIADQCVVKGWATAPILRLSAAMMIDALWALPQLQNYHAQLGGARNFVANYRNVASHPQRTVAQFLAKIEGCKSGFLEGIRIAGELSSTARLSHLRINIL